MSNEFSICTVCTEEKSCEDDTNLTPHMPMHSNSCFLPHGRDKQTQKHNVKFTEVHITTFPIELGDNPCCEGLSLQMSRSASSSRVLEIDTMEKWKFQRRGSSKNSKPSDFKLLYFQRHKILRNLGYTQEELAEALDEKEIIRRRRSRSVRLWNWQQRIMRLLHIGKGRSIISDNSPSTTILNTSTNWRYMIAITAHIFSPLLHFIPYKDTSPFQLKLFISFIETLRPFHTASTALPNSVHHQPNNYNT